jgi:hypothetical protein
MNKKEYTREYLRDNFEFPTKKTEEELFWMNYDNFISKWYDSLEVTYKPFKGIDY